MMIKYVLFDLDGTLMDFHKGEEIAFKETVKELTGYTPSLEDVWKFQEMNESLFNAFARGEMKRIEFQEKRFQDIYSYLRIEGDKVKSNQYFLNCLKFQAILYEDVISCLEYLKTKYKLYIVSNGMGIVQRKRLEVANIYDYFEEIIISDDAGANKPDPIFFEYTLKRIGDSDSSKYIIIGDRLDTDVLGGKNAGMHTVFLNRDSIPTDEKYIVSLKELEKIL